MEQLNAIRTHHWEWNSHLNPDKSKAFQPYPDDECITAERQF